jgi:hypothetical protein
MLRTCSCLRRLPSPAVHPAFACERQRTAVGVALPGGLLAGLHRTVGNRAVLRTLDRQPQPSNGPTAALGGDFRDAQGSATTGPAGVTPASPQDVVAQADSLRQTILANAWRSVRQLQIACQEQADPTLLTQALPDQIRSFYAWLGIGPSDPQFCGMVALVLNDISKNMSMSLPPPYFPTPDELMDPNNICSVGNNFVAANFEGFQVTICPKFTGSYSDVARALTLTHELFHDPSFGMSHDTLDVMNTAHCGFAGSDEAVANPYCVTNVIGDLGAGQVL